MTVSSPFSFPLVGESDDAAASAPFVIVPDDEALPCSANRRLLANVAAISDIISERLPPPKPALFAPRAADIVESTHPTEADRASLLIAGSSEPADGRPAVAPEGTFRSF